MHLCLAAWTKTIFPDTECLIQLKLISNVLGSMSDADIGFINNPKSCTYIKSLPYMPGVPFANLYRDTNPLATDLLQKMFVLDPSKKISVTEALQHPYMSNSTTPVPTIQLRFRSILTSTKILMKILLGRWSGRRYFTIIQKQTRMTIC